MQIKLRCVQKRGHSFFFRLAVPADLQDHFQGKREITQTLDTREPLTAFAKAEALRSSYKDKFNHLRHRQCSPAPLLTQTVPTMPNILPGCPDAPLLSQVLDEALTARPCRYKTTLDRKSAIRLLMDWHGDLPVTQYSRRMLVEFRDQGLRRLPTNVYKDSTFKKYSIRNLANLQHSKLLTEITINNKLSHIGTVFNYAVKHGYLRVSPSIDLSLKKSRPSSMERNYYTKKQLQRLINALAEHTTSGSSVRHQRFWVTLICLYSGSRLNEIAQLSATDISYIEGIPCLNITLEGETVKSLKNTRSSRTIPIHPVLIELGLLRYHKSRLSQLTDPERHSLWSKATCYRDGNWGRKVSRWFGEELRPKFLTKQELAHHQSRLRNYCFHSLRHTFIHYAQNQAQMNPRIEMRLTGHTDAFISEEHARYGKDMHPSILLKELVKLNYGVDLSLLQNRY